ncbi:uncharacterized protein BJ212DRAFT_1309007 [Suillus subaureus]|uniref:Uncharacterized protein n=1 Tax=Suillus subaureus TaxID=48587 RepID=A0A9P7EPJ9_9AGAM|nr:uncharacterized protein BJ212DRAFT_1309007 [Suillus subaureus]KAG1826880.1 hypothetical protein BJ212DRAFT_1309007 [Suillus subaureus]
MTHSFHSTSPIFPSHSSVLLVVHCVNDDSLGATKPQSTQTTTRHSDPFYGYEQASWLCALHHSSVYLSRVPPLLLTHK